jgi:nucleotide sugar dehydrogenase
MIQEAKQIVCIIGVGFIGEHLLSTFKKSYFTIGYDISKKRIDFLKEYYKEEKNVYLTNDTSDLKIGNVFLVSVPTNVNEDKIPNLKNLYDAKNLIKEFSKPGSTVIIESSVYVGATREIFGDLIDTHYIGFSPERVDPGRVKPAFENIPKVISGINSGSLQKIEAVYSKVFNQLVKVSSTECAEMCKLYENCFRLINISYVNEISDLCQNFNIDPHEMIAASATKPFGFLPFLPGLGIGGHCIPVNPYYLMKGNEYSENLPIVKTCIENTNSRPRKKGLEILDNYSFNNVLVIGMAFKPGESVISHSPSIELIKTLKNAQKNVYVYDPIIQQDPQFPNEIKQNYSFITDNLFNGSTLKNLFDIIIIAMPQKNVNYTQVNTFKKLGGTVITF